MQPFQNSTKMQHFGFYVMSIINIVFPFDTSNSQVADIEHYKASIIAWVSDVTNQDNIHKLFCYVAMFDILVDHSNCCGFIHTVEDKIEKAEEKIDEICLKIVEAVTKPKKKREKSCNKKN